MIFSDPASVAVVGASDDPAKWGHWLARGALVQRAVELRLAGAGALAAGLLGRIREVTMVTVRGSVGGGDADDAGDVGDVDL